jgi:hypothetical protein
MHNFDISKASQSFSQQGNQFGIKLNSNNPGSLPG